MDASTLQPRIEALWERRDTLSSATGGEDRAAVEAALEALDSGQARVAEADAAGRWQVRQWLKQAVLLSFRLDEIGADGRAAAGGLWDKVPLQIRRLGREPLPRGRLPRGARRGGAQAAPISPAASC